MAAIKGSKVTLKKGDGASPEVFTTIAGSRNVTFTLGGTEIDITTSDNISSGVTWRSYISGIVDFSANLEGVLKDKSTFDDLVTDKLNGTVANFQLDIDTYGTFEGPMTVTQVDGAGQYDDAATFTIGIRANDAVTWTVTP